MAQRIAVNTGEPRDGNKQETVIPAHVEIQWIFTDYVSAILDLRIHSDDEQVILFRELPCIQW